MSITRKLPRSAGSRLIALQRAKFKKGSTPPAGNFLTPATNDRLDVAVTDFGASFTGVNVAKAALIESTSSKNASKAECYIYTRHFLTATIHAVERKETGFLVSSLAFYGLTTTNPKLPDMSSESQTMLAASTTIDGDTARTAAGGPVMPFPTIEVVTAKRDTFQTDESDHSNKTDLLDTALEAVDNLNEEIDSTIKKVWDEVETFYNEESNESKRASAREWGVVYVRVGEEGVLMSGIVLSSESGEPIGGANITVVETDESIVSLDNGTFERSISALGENTLVVTAEGFEDYQQLIEIPESGSLELNIVLTPTPVPE
jgi:hypothetical protein